MIRFAQFNELSQIRRAAGSDFDAICAEVATNRAHFIELYNCFFVLRVDADGLCVVCAEGKDLLKAAPFIVRAAEQIKANSIVFHTKRPALKRLLRAFGFAYELTDKNGYFVFRMVINGQ